MKKFFLYINSLFSKNNKTSLLVSRSAEIINVFTRTKVELATTNLAFQKEYSRLEDIIAKNLENQGIINSQIEGNQKIMKNIDNILN